MFDDGFARRLAARYRRRGLTPPERSIVEHLAALGLPGRAVLEIGGGVGEIQLELLARGAERTTNLELSGAYEAEASALLVERGLAGRAARVVGVDLAVDGEVVEPADYVVLHRVVCCYPDAQRLLQSAATHARRALVFSHPPRSWLSRGSVRLGNTWMRLLGREYRGYVHAPAAMYDVLERAGFEMRTLRTGAQWWVVAGVRPPSATTV
ncbi:methyltransferase domain-containing protein [Agromyces aurantiacus]|uniref:Methyltransferase domain-containing protein n=1 Tax=Agromyces aurantiacus TaxID=165814 RepID=A0ABV9RAU3_9MICO|nr:methyltransferase domain-containing protein [Agromyces aurantiacus]MBM7504734.1 magnesium-protoporphyrin O-methyltransferase [Agromyces aurantiacus]